MFELHLLIPTYGQLYQATSVSANLVLSYITPQALPERKKSTMSTKSFKNPDSLHQPFSSYTHCVEVKSPSKFLFCSGQIPAIQDGTILDPDDFPAQSEQVIENITAVLANSGAGLSDVVRLVTYLKNDRDVPHVRELLARHFPTNPPANSVCIVKSLTHPDILIEIEATAVL